jgi:hypothetical protein
VVNLISSLYNDKWRIIHITQRRHAFRNHCCCRRAISIARVRACVCDLSYLTCKVRVLYYIVICGLSGCTCFLTLPHNRMNFRTKVTEHEMPVLIFRTAFIWNISHYKKTLTIYCHWCTYLHVKSPLYLSDCNQNLNFLHKLSRKYLISNFIKIHPIGAKLFHADRQMWWS